ncbi:MAG TPA: HAMP domain-containing sensor histidine kinase, partial [Gemmatimonadaceae bacterium]
LLDGNVPALVVPITAFELPAPSPSGELVMRVAPAQGHWRALVVWLDRERLRSQLVAPLVAKHFGEPSTSEFNVSVVSSATGQSLYRSGPGDVRAATADLAADVFALRLTDLHWRRSLPPGTAPGAIPKLLQDRFSITIVRRGAGESADPLSKAGLVGGAEWKLLVRARAGSLDAVVARSRARNLTLSLGVLGILACSLGLILVASAREQRTARQQLEFVAAVSHELRTPLAVIRSAGENLADGVVSGDQIARYGTLISSEGRRLSEMVERVMDFAGIASGTVFRSTRPVDSNAVIDAVVKSLRDESADRSIGFRVRVPSDLPPLLADPDALQSAIQNVVGNAVKYSQPGGEVEIDATATAQTAAIVVRDRGIGIDAADMPHVFEPFYRGRRALDAQIRGSGVGLSVVRKMVEVHGGRVNVTQREGGGTVVTIEWPVAPRDEEAEA